MSEKRAATVQRSKREPQKFDYGNRCGHKKDCFRKYERNSEYKDPRSPISQMIDWVNGLAQDPDKWERVFGRQERSEGRERNAAYIATCFDHMDLTRRWVGLPKDDGSVIWPSVEKLMEGTGIEEEGRFHRAASEMHEGGFITTKRRFQKSDIEGKETDWQYSSRAVRISLIKRSPYFKEYCDESIKEGQRRKNGGETNEERRERLEAEMHQGKPPRKGVPAAATAYFSPEYRRKQGIPDPAPP